MDNYALHKLSYGIYILSTKANDKPYGCIINTAFQITSKPPQIAVSCNRDNFTNQKIKASGDFAISVLSEKSDPELISTFGYQSGKEVDKFKDLTYTSGSVLDLPLFTNNSVATFECTVTNQMEIGTHTVFVGEVVSSTITQPDAEEMTYRYYHDIRKGVAPKNAPTYIEPTETAKTEAEEKWTCSICNYVHDDNHPFEDLPDGWVCPICGATKDLFYKK